jgi:Na+/phosphate symporter
MNPFDWGVYQPWGELILTGTAAGYLFLIVATIRRWSCADLTARHHWVIRWLGFVAIAVMVVAAFLSVMMQLTSVHYQGAFHAPALAVIVGVWLSIRFLGRAQ